MVSKREVMPISSHVPNGGAAVDSGQSRLNQLGYKQELKRDLSVFSNFAISFSIISVLTGVTTLYNTGLRFGGPIVMVYGWFIAGFFTLIVGYSMAEICSSFPTSGGLYYWSAKLAGPKWAPFASWLTGWFNIVGQWAVTTRQLSALWNVVGVFVLMILIPLVSTERASAKFVFTHFNTDNGDGIQNKFYIFVLGLLMSQYTLTGYDASAHMTEETKNADTNGPKGIISAIGISIIVGWGYILGITFAVTDVPHLLSSDNDAGGYAIAQVFYQAFMSRYGSGVGGILCLGVVAVAIFFCGMSSVTSNSRMSYAFSRDGAMPFSSSWHKVNKHEVPINAVWFSAFISFCMALTSLWSLVAFQAMVSIATIGLYISYALPIFFRVTLARKYFVPGPFNLGRFGVLVGWIAVLWVATITVLFSLPVSYPVTKDTLNYTPVAVGGLLTLTVGSWILSARHWFRDMAWKREVVVSTEVQNGVASMDSGQSRLQQLGYKQELKRDLSVVSNFAFSFSILSVLTGITTLYNTGLKFGGPVSMVYGWFIAGLFTLFIGCSMAEICSAYPTSGGLYYWSAELAGAKWAPFASWLTGWFNIVGMWAGTTSIDFSLAQLIQVMILLSTGGNNGGGYVASKYVVICLHGGLLFLHALINSLPVAWLAFFGQVAALWNVVGVLVLMVLIPTVATEKATADFVFTRFNTDNGGGIHSSFYIFILGLLMSQYTLTGYDASAHMTEETKNADRSGPKGIINAIGISIILGWGYLVGITFAVTNVPHLLSSDNDSGGYAIAEVFYDAFMSRYGNGVGGIICLGVVAVAIFFCGMGTVTSNSRMSYAFSRDGAIPFSSYWRKVNRHDVPINAVWFSSIISFCMALPSLGTLVAFQAMVSIATIAVNIAYVLPIFFRVTLARKSFIPGPFNLGRYSILVGWVAVLWVATITVLFSLPVAYPVTKANLNYTPVVVCGLFIIIVSWWILSARFNIVGQWAVTTSIDFSLAQLLQVIILLSTGGNNGGGYEASKYVVICFHAGILFIHALINSLPITLLSFFGQLSALWNVVGVFVLMILIPLVSTERASAKFVFTHFNTDNGDGIQNKFYIFVLGLLMSQYTLTGYDASAHMTEETKNADTNGPKGIISAIGISIIVGWGYILGITFAVTDVPHLLSSDNDAGGYAIAQLQATPGDQFFTGISKRVYFWMSYAFSRDGAMPFSSSWHKVNKHEVPINAVWFSAFISFCMALTSLWSLVAFQAMVSIATIGIYISYALPIFFRVTLARKYFVPGPFNLGRFGVLVGWIAVLWVATITVLFSLPVSYPVTKDTLNYTPVAVGGLLILTVGSWILSARHWFRDMVWKREVVVSTEVQNGVASMDSGQSRLQQLGYKQELKRDLSVVSNFAFSFSIISVLTGITTLYNTGLKFGGPVSMVYGWFIAGLFTLFIGCSMAEICSAYPTSGGLYYWSAELAGSTWAPFASWLTGWFNIVGMWAGTTSVDFSLAQLIQVMILLSTGGNNGGGYVASKYVVICLHGGLLFLHALINSLPIAWLAFFGQLAALWNVVGVLVLMVLIPTVATEKATADFVFTRFNTDNGGGIHSNFYIFILGLLMSQYTFTGYDASAHMTEETKNADRSGPKGIINAIGISIIVGWGYLVGITFAVTNVPHLLSSDNDSGGYAIAEVFYDAFMSRYSNGVGGIICLGVVAVAIFFCGMGTVTSNSRMSYAFSRDGAIPFSSYWRKVNRHEVPMNAVWFSSIISFCMALPVRIF
ncbi:hypothetical protein IFM89_008910 [Coptis chinensis]|uniref:Amino-acid permease BAT1 n=1 Tax=Coptis chinensis TaxID=261450 RepID=A0A835LHF2_9MAGN|nr:hypothetical protein IFM89_008910 [Coptis chinensis]